MMRSNDVGLVEMNLADFLALAECPRTGIMEELDCQSAEGIAFLRLLEFWRSLGRPTGGIWSEAKVDINRLLGPGEAEPD